MLHQIDRLVAAYHNWRMGQAAKEIEDSTGVQLKSVELQENGWRMDLIAPNLLPLLDEATALLNAQSAENYIEFDMLPALRRTNGKPVRVTIQWIGKESPAQQNARLREEVEQVRDQANHLVVCIAAAKHAWDRLGECEEEFGEDAPSACVEWRDSLDGALVRLFQSVCEHGQAENGFCTACGVKV